MKKIVFMLSIILISASCSKTQKTEEYYFNNPDKAKKVIDDCTKWEKNLSDSDKELISEHWFTGQVHQLPKNIQEKLYTCETASVGYKNYKNLKTVNYFKTKLKYSINLLDYCYSQPQDKIPYNVKVECKNAEKAVTDSINGKIEIQQDDIQSFEYVGAKSIKYFQEHIDEARDFYKKCLDDKGNLKEKSVLNKSGIYTYNECLNADKAVNEKWFGSEEYRNILKDYMKDKKLKFN